MAPSLNLSAFKYPLGFIRIVEFLFIVIAIAAINSWGLTVSYKCPGVPPTNVTYNEQHVNTFSLSKVEIHACGENDKKMLLWNSDDSASGSSGFFYFVNVIALVYVLVITFGYVIFWPLYQSEKRVPLIDLGITALLFILFFFCSSIWWAGANTIGSATSNDHLRDQFNQTDWRAQNVTFISREVNNGKLAVSVLADWVCVLCFALNCWFIWKEIVPRDSNDPTSIA